MKKKAAWLIYGREDAGRNQAFIEMHRRAGKKLEIGMELLFAEDCAITIEDGRPCFRYRGRKRKPADLVLCRTRDYLLTRQLEQMGLLVFNNSEVSRVGNDKALAYQEAAALAVPMADTCFCRREHLQETLSKLPADQEGRLRKPLVVKAVSGHGGSQVFLYENKKQLEQILAGIGVDHAVLQPRISGAGEDIRVYVIGNRIQGCVLRRAGADFRSNFSLGGSVFPYTLTKEEEALVHKLFHRWHFDFAGIDFIRDAEGRLLFNEIEDVVGCRMYYQCYEEDILFSYLSYLRERLTGSAY